MHLAGVGGAGCKGQVCKGQQEAWRVGARRGSSEWSQRDERGILPPEEEWASFTAEAQSHEKLEAEMLCGKALRSWSTGDVVDSSRTEQEAGAGGRRRLPNGTENHSSKGRN